MVHDEKIYLVYCLLKDIRLNWADFVEERVELAKKLCYELGGDFEILAQECENFDYVDGRYFRDDFPYGYEGMENLHNCNQRLDVKSEEFKRLVDEYITCPKLLFEPYYD